MNRRDFLTGTGAFATTFGFLGLGFLAGRAGKAPPPEDVGELDRLRAEVARLSQLLRESERARKVAASERDRAIVGDGQPSPRVILRDGRPPDAP